VVAVAAREEVQELSVADVKVVMLAVVTLTSHLVDGGSIAHRACANAPLAAL
jgi:hypothetical protein